MIKFYRKMRYKLIEKGKISKYFKYAIGEIVLVVIGILIALQINNWNEERKDRLKETSILKSLQRDFRADINNINIQIGLKKSMLNDYINALNILANKKKGTKAEFIESFVTILQVGGVDLNATTFNNLQNNGEIKLLKNKTLADSIVEYYNTSHSGWQSSLRDYTRNNIAPYILEFDYIPEIGFVGLDQELQDYLDALPGNNEFNTSEKPIEDYKSNHIIINMLKFKSRNIVGILREYNILLDYAKNLDKSIQNHLNAND